MTTIEMSVDSGLRDLVTLPGRVQSVYFRRPVGDESTAARRHAIVTRLAGQGARAGELRAVDDVLCDVFPGRGAVAFFLGEAGESRLVSMPGAAVTDLAVCSALPDLLPLLRWRQAHPAHVVAVLDRAGADVTIHPGEGAPLTVVGVSGPDDEIAGHAPGNQSQDRFQHRIEESWQRNAARDAEVVAEALKATGSRLLLLAGDVRTVGLFTERLPAWVRQGVTVSKVSGGRNHDGSEGLRAEQVAAAVADHVQAETRALLDEFAAHAAPTALPSRARPPSCTRSRAAGSAPSS